MSILTPPTTPVHTQIQVPIIYVSHLPSASSFYASLTQPLGIQYLSHAPVSPACLNYGYISQTPSGPRKTVVFAVTESPSPSLNHITLTAPSAKAVGEFFAIGRALRRDLGRGESLLEKGADGEEERATTRDFDGNMLEAIYDPRARGQGQVIELETASTEKEARRVLEWQEDVARSIVDTERLGTRSDVGVGADRKGAPPLVRRADSYPLPIREGSRLVRRETISTTENYHEPIPEKKETSTGNAILGGLLGVAAVAGFAAYALRRADSPEPMPARRASEGTRGGGNYSHPPQQTGIVERELITDVKTVRSVAVPARSYVSERGLGNDAERVQPSYVDYVVTTPMPPRELKRIDERSYHSSRAPSKVESVSGSRYDRDRDRPRTIIPSQSPPRERISDSERVREVSPSRESHVSRRSHKSHRSERHRRERSGSASCSPRSSAGASRQEREKKYSSHSVVEDTQSSYTTARSHYSSSTVKIKHQPPAVPVPPPAASLVSTSTVREGGERRRRKSSHSHVHSHHSSTPRDREPRHIPLPESVFSHARDRTARQIPLPESVAGGSEWDRGSVRLVPGLGREYNEYRAADVGGGDGIGGGRAGYAASVAPSDSISSVGMKRERHRLRERMRERGGGGERERERERERDRDRSRGW
jgi:hypothetical protein